MKKLLILGIVAGTSVATIAGCNKPSTDTKYSSTFYVSDDFGGSDTYYMSGTRDEDTGKVTEVRFDVVRENGKSKRVDYYMNTIETTVLKGTEEYQISF